MALTRLERLMACNSVDGSLAVATAASRSRLLSWPATFLEALPLEFQNSFATTATALSSLHSAVHTTLVHAPSAPRAGRLLLSQPPCAHRPRARASYSALSLSRPD
jgi:hypothetical protein